jgi:membrane protein
MKSSRMSPKRLFLDTYAAWKRDNANVWSASLAYFTVFSVGPLLLISISVIGLVLSKTSAEKVIFEQLTELLGTKGADFIQTVTEHTKKPVSGTIGAITGCIALIMGAAGVFSQMQQMLNTVWGVTTKPKTGILSFVRSRLLNFSMVGVIIFLLLVSLLASTAIAGIGTYLEAALPLSPIFLETINFIVSLAVITILFGIILKVLPDVKLDWRDVWPGAVITAVLFTVGKALIGIYIGRSGISSQYGAAASLVILLVWVYYAAQILFFGAEFTKVYTLARGKKPQPNEFSARA